MRKLKLQMQVSIDNFISGTNGEMDWMAFDWDNELLQYVAELTEPVDCIVLGRKLAQGFIPHWAAIPEGEDAAGIHKINSTLKVVFTKTLAQTEWENTVLATGDLVEEVTRLKNQEGGDIIAYGGGTFVASLIKAGLIDEFNFFVNPTAIGKGVSVFAEINPYQSMILKKSVAFACGIVLLCYQPKR